MLKIVYIPTQYNEIKSVTKFKLITALGLMCILPWQAALAADKKTKARESTSESAVPVISEDQLNLILNEQRASGAEVTPAEINAVRNQLLARQLFVRAARNQGLHKEHDYELRVQILKDELLARSYQQLYIKGHEPSDAQVRQAYDALKQRSSDKEYHLKQIFVTTEDEAKDVIRKLEDNADFAELAKTVSKDTSTRDKGGDLGWVNTLKLQAPVFNAIRVLGPGMFTRAPVNVANGWHVIKIEETRPFTLPSLEQLTPQIKQELSAQILQIHLGELAKQAGLANEPGSGK